MRRPGREKVTELNSMAAGSHAGILSAPTAAPRSRATAAVRASRASLPADDDLEGVRAGGHVGAERQLAGNRDRAHLAALARAASSPAQTGSGTRPGRRAAAPWPSAGCPPPRASGRRRSRRRTPPRCLVRACGPAARAAPLRRALPAQPPPSVPAADAASASASPFSSTPESASRPAPTFGTSMYCDADPVAFVFASRTAARIWYAPGSLIARADAVEDAALLRRAGTARRSSATGTRRRHSASTWPLSPTASRFTWNVAVCRPGVIFVPLQVARVDEQQRADVGALLGVVSEERREPHGDRRSTRTARARPSSAGRSRSPSARSDRTGRRSPGARARAVPAASRAP